MSPATKNGAIASKGLKDFGTLEAGKLADILVLDADPLADIKNIRKLNTIVRDGRIVERLDAADDADLLQAVVDDEGKEPVTTSGGAGRANAR